MSRSAPARRLSSRSKEAGTFPATCTVHTDMQMTVIVEES